MGDVPNFLPSVNGLQFINSWPHEPDINVGVPPIGNVTIGSASNGLCGGMVFTVLDVFTAGDPPIQSPQPPAGSPLFNYIVKRLMDSWDLPSGVLNYYQWMTLPDDDTGLWLATLHGVGWRTIVQEWPIIRANLDAGHLSPLGLVTVATADPSQLGKNHQVLAYGYELNGNELTVKVYDPNTEPSSGDSVQLSLSLANPSGTTPITHNIGISEGIRGFFHVPYTACVPRGIGT